MSKREELIQKYAEELEKKAGVKPDMKLLTAVTIGCGPSIYRKDATLVAASDKEEMERVKKNFLIKKLGLSADKHDLDGGMAEVIKQYNTRQKHRAVVYYLLAKHFKKTSVYK